MAPGIIKPSPLGHHPFGEGRWTGLATEDQEAHLIEGIGGPEPRQGQDRRDDRDALDGQPVSLFFLLVGPESAAGPHIKALSRISRLVRRDDIRSRLASAKDAEEFLDALREAES